PLHHRPGHQHAPPTRRPRHRPHADHPGPRDAQFGVVTEHDHSSLLFAGVPDGPIAFVRYRGHDRHAGMAVVGDSAAVALYAPADRVHSAVHPGGDLLRLDGRELWRG